MAWSSTSVSAQRHRVAAESVRPQPWSSARHHTAVLDGLDPAATCRYRVGSDTGEWSQWYEFTTAADGFAPWEFLYFGDAQNGLGEVWPAVAQRAYAEHPDAGLSLHSGDLINDADDDAQWSDWFDAQGDEVRTRNVITTPGNHEYSGDPLLTQYRAHFGYPDTGPVFRCEDAWYADYQGVRFVSLNANVLTGVDQRGWLDRVLGENPQPWTVVTFHQPVFSGAEGRNNPGIRASWLPILEKHDVDLVLQGHDHVYARGHVSDRDNGDGSHSGPVYVVSSAGSKYYDLAPDDANNWTANGATRAVAAEQISTYQTVRVEQDRLVYHSHVARVGDDPTPADAAVGDVLDSVTITRGPDGKRVTGA
ncbi:hypothetical protein DW322_07335 [Rhodococcus rhodnii]|uniref:Calcineurin-like phosphoesterase domain-containing protein n=2 Tax=Rhodococcus rhodnii TaxID=38312 RepID=R7WN77_9NOCA|nr:metallophosphoesterase family protein [Rhodococcus rhodnii]EOM76752.1 hypothetical protein Rrhod_1872 [Rhodococcus rhodnii LMG 5362]TXG90064.1 hypothetical protein DW322_07335 [Rhodococcus rhodnii]